MSEGIKTFTINVNRTAKNDSRDIIKYISKNNPGNALNVLKRIEDRIRALERFPEKGGYVPELLKHNIKDYRQLIEPPWRIIYKIENETVNILLIIDSKRNTQDILVEKLINK